MKVHFEIKKGVYPSVVGGMEVFNYYFIKELAKLTEVTYTATQPYDHGCGKFIKTHSIRPTKYLDPIRLGLNLLIHRPDIVIISYSEAHAIMWNLYNRVLTMLNIPYLIVIHHGKVPSNNNFKSYSRFFRSAKAVIAVSVDIKNNYDTLFGINCIVIPPLVPFQKSMDDRITLCQKYNLPSTATLIGMIGTIKGMKNPDTLIHAIGRMSQPEINKYNPIIVFAGTGPSVDKMKKLAIDLKIENRVFFLGFIPKHQVGEIMKVLDYYVIASDYEGTSVSLLEAMYNGKPIIASNVIGINDTISDKECRFFKARNSNELKEQIITLLEDEKLRNTISINAQKKYNQIYDYRIMLQQYLAEF